jgi:hypothetical protein
LAAMLHCRAPPGNSVFFTVKRIEDPIGLLPQRLILGINKRGIHFFRPVPKEYLHSAELRDIMQAGNPPTPIKIPSELPISLGSPPEKWPSRAWSRAESGLRTRILDLRRAGLMEASRGRPLRRPFPVLAPPASWTVATVLGLRGGARCSGCAGVCCAVWQQQPGGVLQDAGGGSAAHIPVRHASRRGHMHGAADAHQRHHDEAILQGLHKSLHLTLDPPPPPSNFGIVWAFYSSIDASGLAGCCLVTHHDSVAAGPAARHAWRLTDDRQTQQSTWRG